MTRPPCQGCEKRHVGCHQGCEAWLKWKEIHADEVAKIRAEKGDADWFLMEQRKRVRAARHREYMREYMRRKDQ